MGLAPKEVIREEGIENRKPSGHHPRYPKTPENQVGRESYEDERGDEEEVHHHELVGREQAEALDQQDREVAPFQRKVVELLAERRRQIRVGEIPAVVHDVLDGHGAKQRIRVITTRVMERPVPGL